MRIAKATGSPARAYGGWKCFVHNSLHDGKLGMPFGYLRLDRGAATLIVLPYNYPRLFELLEKLPVGPPPQAWLHEFGQYLRSVPWYYLSRLRVALKQYPGTVHISVPENLDPGLPISVDVHLQKLRKRAFEDQERFQRDWERAEREKTGGGEGRGDRRRKSVDGTSKVAVERVVRVVMPPTSSCIPMCIHDIPEAVEIMHDGTNGLPPPLQNDPRPNPSASPPTPTGPSQFHSAASFRKFLQPHTAGGAENEGEARGREGTGSGADELGWLGRGGASAPREPAKEAVNLNAFDLDRRTP